MEHGRGDRDHVAFVKRFLDNDGMGRQGASAMADKHAFGPAGGAARVGHAKGIALVDGNCRRSCRAGGDESIKGRRAVDDTAGPDANEKPQFGTTRRRLCDLAFEHRVEDQDSDIRLVQHPCELVGRIQDRHIDQHQAGTGGAEKHDRILGQVARQDRHRGALWQAPGQQRVRQAIGSGVKRRIAHSYRIDDDGRLVREAFGRAPQHVTGEHDLRGGERAAR